MSTSLPMDRHLTHLSQADVDTAEAALRTTAAQNGVNVTFTVTPNAGTFTLDAAFSEFPAPRSSNVGQIVVGGIVFGQGGMAMSQAEFDQALSDLGGPEPAMLWALIANECDERCGFMFDRKPLILFERHIFARHTNPENKFTQSHPEISGLPYHRGSGSDGYGLPSDQYSRLQEAAELDESAALKACSWGIGQTLGAGAEGIGYKDVQTMVSQMVQTEGLQLCGIVKEINKRKANDDFRLKNFEAFSRIYNENASAEYISKLQMNYTYYVSQNLIDFDLRAVQIYLNYAGHLSIPVDGLMGPITARSLARYQANRGLPITGVADLATLNALERDVFG